MPENKTITDAELAELRRRHDAISGPNAITASWRNLMRFYRMARRNLPSLLARLEAAEREREELRRWRELHKDNTDCPDCNGTAIGCETCTESGLVGIYQRDAKQRREGAIEALEGIAKDHGIDGGKAYIAKVVYREFPDLLHMSVGVVDAADLMQAAKRLREGGE